MNERYKNEIQQVKALGELIGYGNLMDIASILWAKKLQDDGYDNIGAFYPMILPEIKEGDLKEYAIKDRKQKLAYFKELGID